MILLCDPEMDDDDLYGLPVGDVPEVGWTFTLDPPTTEANGRGLTARNLLGWPR